MPNIEYLSGKEQHTSNWGNFYVFGLEYWVAREEKPGEKKDKHHEYKGYCGDIPERTCFSVFVKSGDKRGIKNFRYYICVTDVGHAWEIEASYGKGYIVGNFRVVAEATTIVKASRLCRWWRESDDNSLAFAELCAQFIEKRGVKDIPEFAIAKLEAEKPDRFILVEENLKVVINRDSNNELIDLAIEPIGKRKRKPLITLSPDSALRLKELIEESFW